MQDTQIPHDTPGKLIPALAGGAFIAVFSTIPILNMGNCLCCLWVLTGGFLAVYLYMRNLPPGQVLSSGDGALLGLLAGVFGALFGSVLDYFFLAVAGMGPGQEFLRGMLESRGDLSPELQDMLDDLTSEGQLNPLFVLMKLGFSLVIDMIFGLAGGVIGVSLLRKKNTPQEPAA